MITFVSEMWFNKESSRQLTLMETETMDRSEGKKTSRKWDKKSEKETKLKK